MIIPPGFKSGPAAIFGGAVFDEDLGAGIQVGFGVIGYRGKVWSIKWKGQEIPITGRDAGGDIVPLPSIELAVLKAPNHLSKVWYEQGWSEDASAPPDCASSNGVVPDVGVPKKQNDICATCKWNAFGSRPAQPGQPQQFKGKACSDNKRLAVVPLGDLNNEQYGGPMLLRVPPASLNDVLAIANTLKQIGFPYYAAGIKVSFDMTVSYPRFVFKPIRALTNEEGEIVMKLRDLDVVDRIVHGEPAPAQETLKGAVAGSQPQSQQPQTVAETAPAQPPPTQQAAPVQSPTGFGGSQAPQQSTPQPKTAPTSGFGGNGSGAAPEGVSNTNGSAQPESSGVAQFDKALDDKLKGLL
jgi:hypothetical protein